MFVEGFICFETTTIEMVRRELADCLVLQLIQTEQLNSTHVYRNQAINSHHSVLSILSVIGKGEVFSILFKQ